MTRSRRDRIASAASARDAAGETPVRRGYSSYWVSLSSYAGAPCVDVWLRRPELVAGAWVARREDGALARYARWTLAECARELGTVPDDGRMVLRRDGISGPLPAADPIWREVFLRGAS